MKNILLREKVVLLRTGKMVKIVRREHIETISQKTNNRVDVFIRELDQDTFSPFLNVSHPKYSKFINHLPRQSVILQLRYSGLSKKEITFIIEEFI